MITRMILWIRAIKANALILFYAWRHPRTPRYIKGLMTLVVVYVISPVDLIPDYLPGIGLLDDAILLPTAITLISKLLPDDVKRQCQAKSRRVRSIAPWAALVLALCLLALAYWLIGR